MTDAIRIPFNRPCLTGRELDYIARAVALGNLASDGAFARRSSEILEHRLGIAKVLLTASGTAALEMAAILCTGPGDEVIVPSFTFPSTAAAFVRVGATPVFVDIRPDTLNLDEALLEAAITPRTRAIVPVHYAGVACEMDRIREIAGPRRLRVVEDAAHAVNAFYHGRALGSIGDLGCFSFHETKNYVCGEGGALCVNDPELVERSEIIRDKGTNRQSFFRGLVDRYTWVDVGSSYVLSEIACAFLCAQLEHLDALAERRRHIFERYREALQPLEDEGVLRLPRIPAGCRSNHHNFYVLAPSGAARDALLKHLREEGVSAVFHYVPLHSSPMGRRVGRTSGSLPVTEDVSGRLLRLPFFYGLGDAEIASVAESIRRFFGATGSRSGRPGSAGVMAAPDPRRGTHGAA